MCLDGYGRNGLRKAGLDVSWEDWVWEGWSGCIMGGLVLGSLLWTVLEGLWEGLLWGLSGMMPWPSAGTVTGALGQPVSLRLCVLSSFHLPVWASLTPQTNMAPSHNVSLALGSCPSSVFYCLIISSASSVPVFLWILRLCEGPQHSLWLKVATQGLLNQWKKNMFKSSAYHFIHGFKSYETQVSGHFKALFQEGFEESEV